MAAGVFGDVVGVRALVASSVSQKIYRSDYEYDINSDTFYKLHTEKVFINRARLVCLYEGAQLMVPNRSSVVVLHGLVKAFPDIGDLVWVGADGLAHESADEEQIIYLDDPELMTLPTKSGCEVITRQGEIKTHSCNNKLPFVCKAQAASVRYDPQCKVYSRGYKYFESVGSCYKIPRVAASWNEAYAECRAEGSHLVVLNSAAEQQIIYNITNSELPVQDATESWFFFAGFRAIQSNENPRVFKTIFNQTLEEAGFADWSPGEPNNALKNEYCGCIFKNDGKLNDIDCSHMYGFVCEKEVDDKP